MLEFLDLKMILAIFAALLLLGGGLLKDISGGLQGDRVSNILERVKKNVGKIIDMDNFRVQVKRDIPVRGEIDSGEEYDLTDITAERVTLSYPPKEMNITADSKNIKMEGREGEITLKEFEGGLTISPEDLKIDGNTGSLSSKYMSVEGSTSISADGEFNKVSLVEVRLKEFKINGSEGEIDIGPSVVISTEEKPVALSGFLGNITFSKETIKLSGNVSRATAGEEGISISAGS